MHALPSILKFSNGRIWFKGSLLCLGGGSNMRSTANATPS
uniref:Uncharacterized protein n=1 Tax=Anguilla anguilla TaxID=7936 RepID=A0A0E9SUA0_ANGAN